jgi:hypothetical protein
MSDYRKEMNQAYWEGFISFMAAEYPGFTFGHPSKESYQIVPPILRPGVRIAVGVNRKDGESIRADVTLTNTPQEWTDQLLRHADEIQREVGIAGWSLGMASSHG